MTLPLPDFTDPPLSEVAMAVMFEPVQRWNPAYAGIYWNGFRADYPEIELQPPIEVKVEAFGKDRWQTPSIQITPADPDFTRFWFHSPDKTRLLQLQRDAFIVNWRRITGDEPYPRYTGEMRGRLEREWTRFQNFVAENNLGDIKVVQCELTYVNDIMQGRGWNKLSDAFELINFGWNSAYHEYLGCPDSASMNFQFDRPDDSKRLKAEVRHVKRIDSGEEAFQVKLVAKGAPHSSEVKDLLAWMDDSREWIVRGFADLTTPKAHKIWGRKA